MYTYEDIILALAWYFRTGSWEEDYLVLKRCWISYWNFVCQNSCLTGTNIYETGTPGQQSPNRDCPGETGTIGTFVCLSSYCMRVFQVFQIMDIINTIE